MTILNMQVRLYTSAEGLAAGTPEWTGTLNEFWGENQDSYAWGQIRDLADELRSTGSHRGGGGAAPAFWLVRGEMGTPRGWDVAETGTELDELTRLHEDRLVLVTALHELAVWVRDELDGRLEVESLAAARQLLATHGARV